jgi:hypothetical protein
MANEQQGELLEVQMLPGPLRYGKGEGREVIRKSCDTMNDIALFRLPVTSTPDKKTKERKDWPLAEWKRMAEGIWAKDEKSWEATKVTRPQCKTSHDAVT